MNPPACRSLLAPPPPEPRALLAASDWLCALPLDDFVNTVCAAARADALTTPQKTETTRRNPSLAPAGSRVGPGDDAGASLRPAPLGCANAATKALTLEDVARLQQLRLRDAAAAFGVGETKVLQCSLVPALRPARRASLTTHPSRHAVQEALPRYRHPALASPGASSAARPACPGGAEKRGWRRRCPVARRLASVRRARVRTPARSRGDALTCARDTITPRNTQTVYKKP